MIRPSAIFLAMLLVGCGPPDGGGLARGADEVIRQQDVKSNGDQTLEYIAPPMTVAFEEPLLVEVSFTEWTTTSRYRYSPEELKRIAQESLIQYSDSSVYRAIAPYRTRLSASENCDPLRINGRLLVEVTFPDDRTETYFSDHFCFCELTENVCMDMDQMFEEHLSELIRGDGNLQRKRE